MLRASNKNKQRCVMCDQRWSTALYQAALGGEGAAPRMPREDAVIAVSHVLNEYVDVELTPTEKAQQRLAKRTWERRASNLPRDVSWFRKSSWTRSHQHQEEIEDLSTSSQIPQRRVAAYPQQSGRSSHRPGPWTPSPSRQVPQKALPLHDHLKRT